MEKDILIGKQEPEVNAPPSAGSNLSRLKNLIANFFTALSTLKKKKLRKTQLFLITSRH